MDDIVLERGQASNSMKMDADEQALLDEIQITTRPSAPARRRPPPRPPVSAVEPDMDAFINPAKQRQQMPQRPRQVQFEEEEMEEEPQGYEQEQEEGPGGGGMGSDEQPSPGYSSIDDEKADLLNKLSRLEKKGINVNKRINAYSDISEIRTEYKRHIYAIEAEQSIKFQRRMLIAAISGMEFLNKRYDPFSLALEGWSESIMENIDDYDGVFEELYSKYRTKVNVAPEVKLLMMVGGSGMMFHLTNSMFKAAVPNINEVMKQNPDLIKNMVSAVQNTQKPGQRSDPTARPVATPTMRGGGDGTSSRREMQGPGLDISSLMGGIMMPPPPPMNTKALDPVIETQEIDLEDDMSDIISVSGESYGDIKEVKVSAPKKRGGGRKKKTEVSM
jgi:hypothetical protein